MNLKTKTLIGLFLSLSLMTKSQDRPKGSNLINVGSQIWTTENLTTDRFRNGELIKEAKSLPEWNTLCNDSVPAWCYYNFDFKVGKLHGKLYNYFAVIDKKGLAPQGWHIPTDDEWKTLLESLGGSQIAGKKLKAQTGWSKGNGNNLSGFSALPNGFLECEGSNEQNECFRGFAVSGRWWSSTKGEGNEGDITGNYVAVFDHTDEVDLSSGFDRTSGYAVRCLKSK